MTFPRQSRRALAAIAALVATVALAVGTAIAADHRVEITGLSYRPAEITITVGDTITWEVTGSVGAPHSVTSGAPGDPDAGSAFDSGAEGLMNVGETYELTFDQAGTFPYYCTVHGATMSGVVTVLEPGASGPPPAEQPGEGGEVEGVPIENKLISAGILVAALVVLFGAAVVWRRMNPA